MLIRGFKMASTNPAAFRAPTSRWRELVSKEDWWAIWIGLAIVFASCILFWSGGNLRWLAVLPPKWASFSQVTDDLAANWTRYAALYVFWLASFSFALSFLGYKARLT